MFDVDFRTRLERQLDDREDLRRAIEAGEIMAWFQPIIDLGTGNVVGAETLARWAHPQRGVLDAAKFIPMAEEFGLVADLDREIVRQALRARVLLGEAGFAQEFRVWFNISPMHFASESPALRLANGLANAGCDPRGVGIEITESAALGDVRVAAAHLAMARALGVQVALDDFGTGHSSLTLLRDLPIDHVKIDRTFVEHINVEGRSSRSSRVCSTWPNASVST